MWLMKLMLVSVFTLLSGCVTTTDPFEVNIPQSCEKSVDKTLIPYLMIQKRNPAQRVPDRTPLFRKCLKDEEVARQKLLTMEYDEEEKSFCPKNSYTDYLSCVVTNDSKRFLSK